MTDRARRPHVLAPISRHLDLRWASNRFAVFWTAVSSLAAGIAWLVNGEPLTEAALGAVYVGIGVFLAWALGRELDPDHPATARWAAMLALLFAATLGTASLLATAMVMVTARMLVRTTGLTPTPLDLLVLATGGVLAAGTIAGAVGALVLATALVLDLRFANPGRTGPTAAAAIAIIVAGAVRLALADPPAWIAPGTAEIVVAALLVIGLVPPPTSTLTSVGDVTKEPLDPQRLAAARWLVLITAPVALLVGGEDEITSLSPVVAAVAGLGLNNLRRHVRAR